jgi:hypothetical protein
MTTQHRAYRAHTCDACRGQIAQGEVYTAIVTRPWDHPDNDGFGIYRMHTYPCEDAYALANEDLGLDEWCPPQDVIDALDPRDFDDGPAALALVNAFHEQCTKSALRTNG